MLRLIRRHLSACPHSSQRYRRCRCPIHVYGTLGGQRIRKALDLNSWEAATDIIREWETVGEIGAVREEPLRVADAVAKFLADCQARHLRPTTIRRYRDILEKRLVKFADSKGLRFLKQLDIDALHEFRAGWTYAPVSSQKRLQDLRAFFNFSFRSGWTASNPAASIKPPKTSLKPTLPFSQNDMAIILKAAEQFTTKGKYGPGIPTRVKALVLLLRYSGLRIGDAVALERSRVAGGKLFLYTQKTGTPVRIPLPDNVLKALAATPNEHADYFFWNGRCLKESAVKIWERTLKTLFEKTDIQDGHAHRFRDTFAVELLLKGVPLEDVSVLMGHSSLKVTEKHYSPWVKARQEQLEAAVRKAW